MTVLGFKDPLRWYCFKISSTAYQKPLILGNLDAEKWAVDTTQPGTRACAQAVWLALVPGCVVGHVAHCSSNLSHIGKGHRCVSRPFMAMLMQGSHGQRT